MSVRRRHAAGLLMALLLLIPILPIGYINLRRSSLGQGFEPIGDNLLMYGLLVVLLVPAAVVTTACYLWLGVREDHRQDTVLYALAGAAASGVLTTYLDVVDDYFSRPGIGWHMPLTGLVLGAFFGAAFGALSARSSR